MTVTVLTAILVLCGFFALLTAALVAVELHARQHWCANLDCGLPKNHDGCCNEDRAIFLMQDRNPDL